MLFPLVLAALAATCSAYRGPQLRRSAAAPPAALPEGMSPDGYGPVGSLLRQGPVPFIIRLVKPDTYDQAVRKYMNIEKVDRTTAQANMDAYFQDPNGWAGQKLRERKGQAKPLDYNGNVNPSQLVLTGIWASGFLALCYRIFEVQVLDK